MSEWAYRPDQADYDARHEPRDTGGEKCGARKIVQLLEYLSTKGIDIRDLIARANSSIKFISPHGGSQASGYEATILQQPRVYREQRAHAERLRGVARDKGVLPQMADGPLRRQQMPVGAGMTDVSCNPPAWELRTPAPGAA